MFRFSYILCIATLFTLAVSSKVRLEKRGDLSDLPACSQGCYFDALFNNNGGCDMSDYGCLCGKQEFRGSMNDCFYSSCSGEANDASNRVAYVRKLQLRMRL
ncbi:secreted protein [Melampsora americana]|nr:secreted protein [Melampsora americana]